jgi:hypothetical protein
MKTKEEWRREMGMSELGEEGGGKDVRESESVCCRRERK